MAGGNKADLGALGPDKEGRLNPFFLVSSFSDKFLVHNTSDPLTGFHLTSFFDSDVKKQPAVEAMVTLAKSQFRDWVRASANAITFGSAAVNLYNGDAVSFCHELAAKSPTSPCSAVHTRLFSAQWSNTPLLLDGEGAKKLPLSIDVIDTSNLVDWLGMLNILIPTSQLLSHKPSSVLYSGHSVCQMEIPIAISSNHYS